MRPSSYASLTRVRTARGQAPRPTSGARRPRGPFSNLVLPCRVAPQLSLRIAADLPPEEIARRRRRRVEIDSVGRRPGSASARPRRPSRHSSGSSPRSRRRRSRLIGKVHTLIALARLQNGEPAATRPRSSDRWTASTEVGEQIGDPSIRASRALVGLSQVFTGAVRAGVAALEEALPLMEGRHESIGTAFARGASGSATPCSASSTRRMPRSRWRSPIGRQGRPDCPARRT